MLVLAAGAVLMVLSVGYALLVKNRPRNPAKHVPPKEAFASWQRGRQYVRRIDSPMKAISELRRAVQLDPQFADAYATLAAAYGMAGLQRKVPMDVAMRQAKELAERAIFLDADSAEGYLMLGAAEVFNRDWKRAEDLMRRSLELRPNDAFSLMTTATIALQPQGKTEEAAQMLEKAVRLEPENMRFWAELIEVRGEAHQFTLALDAIRRALQHDNQSAALKSDLAYTYLWTGRIREASELIEQVGMSETQRDVWNLELALAQKQSVRAAGIAKRLLTTPGLDDANRAALYAVLGKEDQALAYLNREEDNRSLKGVLYARFDDHFNAFRSHQGFQQLLRRMRLN
jgi:tetratricopeptide (TPR) repeat protein